MLYFNFFVFLLTEIYKVLYGEMNNNMKKWLVRIGRGLLRHPVELIVLLCATVEVNVDPAELTVFAPFAVVASLSLSFYRHKRWANWVYWAVLPIYVLCVFLPAKWCEKPETWLLYALLVPTYLLARGGDFSKRLFSMVRSLVVSLGIGALTCLLLMLIYGSITMLFNTRGESYRTVMSFSFVLLAPMVFIGMESSKGEIKASKLEEVLVN